MENIALWQKIANSKWLGKIPVFVALNKTDLFKVGLKYQSLKLCFGDECKGRNSVDPCFVGINVIQKIVSALLLYDIKDIEISLDVYGVIGIFFDFRETEYWLDQVYKDGIEFIRNKFLEVRSDIKIYEICAVNIEEVDQMMKDIQQQICVPRR